MLRAPRAFFKQLHIWLGLTVGAVVAIMALAGSVIVFRTELETAMTPRSQHAGADASLDELTRQVALRYPDAAIARVRMPAAPEDPFVVQLDNDDDALKLACDRTTGRVVGTIQSGWVSWLIDLHRNLLAGKTGRKVAGYMGIGLFLLSLSGLSMWLLGARNWRAWITVRPAGSARRFQFELHRASGLWGYAFLALISFTGIGMAFPDTYRAAIQSMTGSGAKMKTPKVSKAGADVALPLAEYLRLGQAAMPDGRAVELRLPDGKGPVDLRLWRRGDLSPDGNHVYLEPASGKVLGVSKEAELPLGAHISAALSPIHYGEFGGIWSKILWSVGGLAPITLFLTGFLTWLRPRPARPKPSAKPQPGRMGLQQVHAPEARAGSMYRRGVKS